MLLQFSLIKQFANSISYANEITNLVKSDILHFRFHIYALYKSLLTLTLISYFLTGSLHHYFCLFQCHIAYL